jgi:ABC-type transport system involved in multi-copper enzyme maturation permease subunit
VSAFREVFRFELRLLLGRASTWIYFAALLAGSVLSGFGYDRGSGHLFTTPMNVAGYTLLMGLMGMLVSASLFGDAASRDVRTGMHPLFHTLPLTRRAYLGGRFAGAFVVNAILLLAIPLGLLIAAYGLMEPDFVGPFRAEAYAQPFLLFVLPNLLINGALLFGFALLSRRALPGYLAALGLFMGYTMAFAAAAAVESSPLAPFLDASGLIAGNTAASGWTHVERGARLVPLAGPVLWNRVAWLAIALLTLAATWSRFRFAHPAVEGRRRRAAVEDERAPAPGEAVPVPAAPRFFGVGARLRQTVAIAASDLREVVRSREFIAVAVGTLIFVLGFGGEMMTDDRFGIPSWRRTSVVIGFLDSFLVAMLVSLLTAFYAGELVWRERDARTSELTDAAPLPDWVPFAGKLLALVLLLACIQATLMAAGIGMQLMGGVRDIEIGLYLRVMFGMQMADYLLLAVVAVLIHALARHKYVGHLLVVAFYLATVFPRYLGIENPMLVYGSDPGWSYSDMAGFGPFLPGFFAFKLYWAAWALLLAVLASLFWVRGTETGARRRMRLASLRMTRPMAAGAALSVALVLGLGGFVFYNTHVLNEYRTAFDQDAGRAEYERRYGQFENAPQPWVTRARLNVELYPAEGGAETRGSYHLVNRGSRAIDSVHVSLAPNVTATALGFDRPARRVLEDPERGYWIFRLARPLAPGDSLRMDFAVSLERHGFTHGDARTDVVGNGTFLTQRMMPSIGYQRIYEIPDAYTRSEHGLPPRPFRPSIHDSAAVQVARSASDAGWIDLETTIGTAPGQTAVAPGTLVREWRSGGRRYFHYRTDAPVLNFYGIFSAEYAVREATWNGVHIQVLYHPTHGYNVERMVRAARASLDDFSRAYGPYPHPQLRLVEFPRYQRFARAYPGMIVFSEGTAMLAKPGERDIDSPFFVTAHEMGHQWWGHQVMGANVQGSQMLSETLAQYGALMVMEREYGAAPVHRLLPMLQIEYLNRRGTHASPEVPLMLTGDHDHIHYRKGAVVMYALREFIGEERVNHALREVVRRHGYRGPPFPTTLDLYRELQAVTPDSLQYLLEDLVATITVWDLRADGARAVPAGGGAWRVTLDVEAHKLRSDSVGNHTEVPMNDVVEIGVFADDGEYPGRPLYLARHRLRAGQRTITVTVPGRPARAGIDPYHKLLTLRKEEMDRKLAPVEIGG